MAGTFLDLVYDEAPREEFDRLLRELEVGSDPAADAEVRRQHDVALRLRDTLLRQRSRESELTALYDTAGDLTAIRDLDTILAAIVRRARQLLNADMTYLSLNDEAEGASYMRVTDGALTGEFRRLRLPLGTGLLGLVAQTGAPYFTEDYQADQRFVHRGYIDDAVAGEQIRAILGVPLLVDGAVIGALLAVHRTVRPFPAEEVSLLTSFAAHAAVALENARLFDELEAAHRTMTASSAAVERAAEAHDRLTDLLLHGGGVDDIARALTEVLSSPVSVHGPDEALTDAARESARTGRAVPAEGAWVSAALAGAEHLATVVLHDRDADLDEAERRTLERGSMVTAAVLLIQRAAAEAEERLGSELLADLLDGRERDPARLRERARRRGVVLEPPVLVAVADVDGLDRYVAARASAGLAASRRGLAAEVAGTIVVAASGTGAVELGTDLRDLLARAGGEATVGVAAAGGTDAVAAVAAAHDDARRCLGAMRSLGRAGEVADARGLGLSRLLLGDNGPGAVRQFLADALGPVEDWDRARGTSLVDTLEAWFAAGGRLRETAAALHVHPNTVTQRLDRVAELLGSSWRDPERSLDLQLALRLRRLHRG